MVEDRRFELLTIACKAIVFPIKLIPHNMAPLAGLKPATLRLEGACSIQLNYRGILIGDTSEN